MPRMSLAPERRTPARLAGALLVMLVIGCSEATIGNQGEAELAVKRRPPPSVKSISPVSGSTSGGTAVSITGVRFAAGATVLFDSQASARVTFVDSSNLIAESPAHPAGTVQ